MSATTLHEPCVKCKGNGRTWVIEPDSDDRGLRDDCPDCGGTGRVDSPAALARLAALEAERDQARNLLRECWDAAGLLDDRMTGQPEQYWDGLSDLVAQIEDLWSKAQDRDDAEQAQEDLESEVERLRAGLRVAWQFGGGEGGAA